MIVARPDGGAVGSVGAQAALKAMLRPSFSAYRRLPALGLDAERRRNAETVALTRSTSRTILPSGCWPSIGLGVLRQSMADVSAHSQPIVWRQMELPWMSSGRRFQAAQPWLQ